MNKSEGSNTYFEKPSLPRLELPKNNPKLKKKLQDMLADYRTKIASESNDLGLLRSDDYYVNVYAEDVLSHLLTDGQVDTNEIYEKMGKEGIGSHKGRFGQVVDIIEKELSTE